MGNSSSVQSECTQQQKDVKHLGERMPFGDEEIRHVYRAYEGLKRDSRADGGDEQDDDGGGGGGGGSKNAVNAPQERSLPFSFLSDVGVNAAAADADLEELVATRDW